MMDSVSGVSVDVGIDVGVDVDVDNMLEGAGSSSTLLAGLGLG